MYTIGPRLLCLLIVLAATNVAAAQTSFTISGTVTNTSGTPMPDVAVVLLSDAAGTKFTFTNQSGNYTLTYAAGVSHNLRITPTKSGFVFNPLAVGFISTSPLFGNLTQSFVGTPLPIQLPFNMPLLMTQENSLRSLALDSVTLVSEPFGVTNTHNFSSDQRTRLTLFAMNVELDLGEPLSVITAHAENSVGVIFPVTVEALRAVPNFPWLKQVVVKLPDEIANSDEVRMSINARGTASNKVLVKVKP